MWFELLGHGDVDPDAHFFEVGGHSLRAAALATQASRHFRVPVTVGDIYQHLVFKALAAGSRLLSCTSTTTTGIAARQRPCWRAALLSSRGSRGPCWPAICSTCGPEGAGECGHANACPERVSPWPPSR
ncbi:acyl carrier protein [Pseudomonas sp. Irchel 3E20]|uniref:acyl carrier protein n=1 Tax=Pseudomonas sp. Irchel 3E20 TaxID=2008983 RepID=UPI00353171AD